MRTKVILNNSRSSVMQIKAVIRDHKRVQDVGGGGSGVIPKLSDIKPQEEWQQLFDTPVITNRRYALITTYSLAIVT